MGDAAVIAAAQLNRLGFTAFFTRRGDRFDFSPEQPECDENLRHLTRITGCPQPHQAIQTHQCGALWCAGDGSMHRVSADILLSDAKRCAVAVRSADCLPILLADVRLHRVAAIHAGWRGTAAAVACVAVRALLARGSRVEDLYAAMGPSIGRCCFRIDTATAQALCAHTAAAAQYIHPADGSQCYADLAAINRLQLRLAGVAGQQIEQLGDCTYCHPSEFFSYRREGAQAGRHLAVVATP